MGTASTRRRVPRHDGSGESQGSDGGVGPEEDEEEGVAATAEA